MEKQREIRLETSWKNQLIDEFDRPYMDGLREFLLQRKRSGAVIYPPGNLIFNALDSTPFEQVRVVEIPCRELHKFDPAEQSFQNINTPEEYHRLREASSYKKEQNGS